MSPFMIDVKNRRQHFRMEIRMKFNYTTEKLTANFTLFFSYSFPNKMVLGRTHIKDVAAKRKVELNSYIQSLMNSSPEVAEVSLSNLSKSRGGFWILVLVNI